MSGVQRAHRDKEERPVTWEDLDQLASGDPWVQMVVQVPKGQWVMLVHKVQAAILGPQAHQDLREALVSLVSKDNWEMLVYQVSKERLDPKENLVHQDPRVCLDLREKKGSEDSEETLAPSAPWVPSVKGEHLVTEDSLVLMGCQDLRVLKEIEEYLGHQGRKVL